VTDQEDALNAYLKTRSICVIIGLPLITAIALTASPFKGNPYNSVYYHSDKTAAVVTGKEEITPWYFAFLPQSPMFTQWLVSYRYSIGDAHYTHTEDTEDKNCFDKMDVDQQIYIFFDKEKPEQSYTECKLNRLTGRRVN
jgi:hypothetical protein